MANRPSLVVGTLALAAALALAVPAAAQRGGGGRGGGGVAVPTTQSRLDALESSFRLTKDQKKTVKTILDDAFKRAAAAREGLTKTHAALAAAVQGGKPQAEIDAAAKSYGEQAAAMTAVEMKALADVMKALDPEQRANNAAISSAFFLLRGAFLDPKKWDDVPDGRMY